MACRIGMSTEPQSRIDYWKRQEGHIHSRVLARNLTYDAAQARESREAAKRGCRRAPGSPFTTCGRQEQVRARRKKRRGPPVRQVNWISPIGGRLTGGGG